MNILRKTNQVTNTVSKGAVKGILVLLTIAVSYQVLGRYVEVIPRIMWTEEFARASLIWLVFLGAAFAFHEGGHFRIELLPAKLGPRVLGNIERLAQVVTVTTLVILTLGSVTFFLAGFARTSTMSGASLAWSYLAMPVSFAIMLLRSFEDLFDAWGHPEIEDAQMVTEGVR